MRFRFFIASVFLALGFFSLQAKAQEPLGMVVDVQGAVSAAEGGKSSRVEMLSYLRPNMDLELAAGAALSVTWYADSKEYRFSGPSRLKVSKERIQVVQGAGAKERSLGEAKVAAGKGGANRLAQATIMMRSIGPAKDALTPTRNARFLDVTPRISWRGADDMGYRFTLTDAQGKPLIETVVKGNAVQVPADKLAFGESYRWKAQFQPAGSATVAEGDFSIVSRADAERLAKLKPGADAAFSDWLLYAMALEELSLTGEARPIWKKLAAERPAEPKLKQYAER